MTEPIDIVIGFDTKEIVAYHAVRAFWCSSVERHSHRASINVARDQK